MRGDEDDPIRIRIPVTFDQMATWMLSDLPAWWRADLILANRYQLEARQSDQLGCHTEATQYRDRADQIYGRVTKAYLQYQADLAEEESRQHRERVNC
jgi:hypothetical protein